MRYVKYLNTFNCFWRRGVAAQQLIANNQNYKRYKEWLGGPPDVSGSQVAEKKNAGDIFKVDTRRQGINSKLLERYFHCTMGSGSGTLAKSLWVSKER